MIDRTASLTVKSSGNNSNRKAIRKKISRDDRISFLKRHGALWRKGNLIVALSCLTDGGITVEDSDTGNYTITLEIVDNNGREQKLEVITNLLTKLCYTGTCITADKTAKEGFFVLRAVEC